MKHLIPGTLYWAELLFCHSTPDNIHRLVEAGVDVTDTRWHLLRVDENKLLVNAHDELTRSFDPLLFRLVIPSMNVHIVPEGSDLLKAFGLDETRQLNIGRITTANVPNEGLAAFYQDVAIAHNCSVIAYKDSFYMARY